MTKIQRHHQPKQPSPPPATIPATKNPTEEVGAVDRFLKDAATAVYQNHPLVMLCTQPQLRSIASEVPVIKEVADTLCPIVPGARPALKTAP